MTKCAFNTPELWYTVAGRIARRGRSDGLCIEVEELADDEFFGRVDGDTGFVPSAGLNQYEIVRDVREDVIYPHMDRDLNCHVDEHGRALVGFLYAFPHSDEGHQARILAALFLALEAEDDKSTTSSTAIP